MGDGRLRVISGEVAPVVETLDPQRFQAECVEAFVASWTARGFADSTIATVAELRNHFGVSPEEASWAGERTDSESHLPGLVVLLKCFVKMGRFPGLGEVPDVVVDFVRRSLELPADTVAVYGTDRSERAHKALIRDRVGVRNDQKHARAVAEAAMRAAAAVKNNPPDLINVALEKLTEASLEFPAYSTLDNMCGRVRREVNRQISAPSTSGSRRGSGLRSRLC